jgi:tRNA nucleotidyltransferase (CCA-adding enzyme)
MQPTIVLAGTYKTVLSLFIVVADRIHLTEVERKIFALLKECVVVNGLQVNLRVAGGWVRDKILGLESHDVDIAIDTMMGETFTNHLCAFMKTKNLEARAVGVIQSNPDRSKHLETATMALFGQPVDFVNLRAEEYAAGSRIPQKVIFGSPMEDALRRDITINSLFYHIQNETIEDWTGKGLLDLVEGIIRTPLCPETTLLDDPLRLLRMVRFGSRYGYALVPDIIETAKLPRVKEAFLAKVSRERVGIEFEKTVSNPNGLVGLHLYDRVDAFPLLTMRKETIDYHQLLVDFEQVVIPHVDKETRRLALMSFPMIPFASDKDAVNDICRVSLKLGNKDSGEVLKVLKNSSHLIQLTLEASEDCVLIGRQLKEIGSNWRLAIWIACCKHIFEQDSFESHPMFILLVETIERLNLIDAWRFTPLISVPLLFSIFISKFRERKFKKFWVPEEVLKSASPSQLCWIGNIKIQRQLKLMLSPL